MNEQLPIVAFLPAILAAVKSCPVVIVRALTGAGKSTQVPKELLGAGFRVVVTQPRRLAARTVSERVAEELGEELGGRVGYRTAMERCDSPATRLLYCTDGLALVRELFGRGGNRDVLVLDEVHEWNLNLETLVAWVKLQLSQGADFKVVLMSATMEAEKLAAFFDGAPVIDVPGRLFPVEERRPRCSVEDDVAALVREGRNVLVFQPGKAEIAAAMGKLQYMQVGAEVLPLHGELEPSQQRKCFQHYGRPKVVVSTNVAQTSVTIDDIDAVVDSGMERRVETVEGVEGLYLKPISLADSTQRRGRAGRTKAGVYIDHCPASDRSEFARAEILRLRLDQVVLRLAEAGFDAEELEFFHQPPREEIHRAKETLKALGCMDVSGSGSVTAIGRKVAKMPVSVEFGRMLVEADRLGVVDDLLSVAAILEVGEVTDRKNPEWLSLTNREKDSDVLAQLAVFGAARRMSKDEMREKGVHVTAYFKAVEMRRKLAEALRGRVRFGSSGKREDILKAVAAGMVNHLFKGSFGDYRNGDGVRRELAKESVVARGADWLVGLPWDLHVKTKRGSTVIHLLRMVTRVDPMVLAEVAPHLVRAETGLSPGYDPQQDVCLSTTRTWFKGQQIKEDRVADAAHPKSAELFAGWAANQMY